MRIVLVNQFFYPDIAATAQIATDLAVDLSAAGHEVTAIASRGLYAGGPRLPPREQYCGVSIVRLGATSFGRRSLVARGADYASFLGLGLTSILTAGHVDVVICLSTPPFVAIAGALARALRATKFVYWVQDLYPEVAVAFGVLSKRSLVTKAMARASNVLLRRADRVVVLGHAMQDRVIAAGASTGATRVIPNWSDDTSVHPVSHADNPLRQEWARGGKKFLVGYSGNIGRGHDVETLLEAAALLSPRADIGFLFIGGGAGMRAVELAKARLGNIQVAPYQPRERLAESLSAADVHLISMAPEVVGLIEPSKLYGVMAAGRPSLFVGPEASEAARIIEAERCGFVVPNGNARLLAERIGHLADYPHEAVEMGARARAACTARYSRGAAVGRWKQVLAELDR